MQKILVTGAAGFIGFHLTQKLCAKGAQVLGYDNMNDYYDVSLKEARLAELKKHNSFEFIKADLEDHKAMEKAFTDFKPEIVVNLAAQAGVRYSLDHPREYIDTNVKGFINILEASRKHDVKHLVYASSSSVYGANKQLPYSENDNVDYPVSLYAATKKSNELIAHCYAHIYGLPCTGLRFFTVYGPWGRPDMAYYKFADKIMKGEPIDVYNHGDMKRDFTYIDDIVDGIERAMINIATPDEDKVKDLTFSAPYRVYNIGNNESDNLMDMIAYLEEALGEKAQTNMLPMQPGDVYETYADIDALARDTGYKPTTDIKTGLEKFVAWYREFYS